MMLILYLTSVNESETERSTSLLEGYIAGIAENDNEALEALYYSTKASVFAFALSVLKNTQDAEDVLHDCFISIYTSAGSYRSHGKPLAWILTITRNLCFLKLREHRKFSDLPQEDWESFLKQKAEITPEDRLIISECMNRLNDEERQIVVLHAVSGFKHREISSFLGLPLSTVLSKYNRALKKLKTHLTTEER